MKKIFVDDVTNKYKVGDIVTLLGWVRSYRVQKSDIFFDLCDSSGEIQVVANKILPALRVEQSVEVQGVIALNPTKNANEIHAIDIKIIGDVKKDLSPNPRSDFDIFSTKYVDYVQENRHLFIRNPKVMAALRARELVMGAVRNWFAKNGFIEITAPILTPILLYTEDTGISVNVNDQDVFLTQCVAFYLESAVHAFERVYNIGPSFRGAESISTRHLTEYWHVKAEIAFCSFDDIFDVVESMISFVAKEVESQSKEICKVLGVEACFSDAYKIPFPRITYRNAIDLCNQHGVNATFGKSLGDSAENFLSSHYGSPVWITHNARTIEGFPYKIYDKDEELTYTADLIATGYGGELLGIADKIVNKTELETRLKEKGKDKNNKYDWFLELREYGTVPHCGIGMGLERLIRWLYQLSHVREAMPFPRSMARKIYP